MIGIYKITSPSGRIYIGQTWNFKRRVKNYRNLPEGKQHLLYNSFKKYGFENHEIKMICELPEDVSQDVMDTYEQVYLDAYRDSGCRMMNAREAGANGKLSEETKQRLSEAKKGIGKGRKQSEEWIKKRTACQVGNKNWLNKKHKKETKEKMSVAALGKPKSEEHAKRCVENLKK